MKIDDAVNIFKTLISRTDKKTEIKIYQKFVVTLDELGNKDLSEEQFRVIETELDSLNLDSSPDNKKRFYRKGFNKFMKFLREEFSLIAEGYYTGIGMALGICFGVALGGSLSGGPGVGLSLGLMFGLVIGAAMDKKAKKENRVIRTTLKNA